MSGTDPAVDVVTVGAGWTSNILAWKLTAAGKRVVALEQGDARWAYPNFAKDHDSLAYSIRKAMMTDIARETWTWRPNPNQPALPMRQFGSFHPGAGIGGSAMHWSAMLWRFLPTDFEYRTNVIDRYGSSMIPEGSTIRDWPIRYEDLEPYYDAFEWDVGASGIAGNVRGEIRDGGNPFEAPRSRGYPLPPLERSIPSQMFADASIDLGYHPFPQPAGILSQAYEDPLGNVRSGCMYCGFCTRYGCEVDAKATGMTTHIPPAMATGLYEIRTGAHVLRVDTDGDRATGVTYADCDGRERFQPADVVVLSGYPLTNVKLLLASRGKAHPNGVGNARGLVGTNFTYQLWETPVTGLWEDRDFHLYMGNSSTTNVIYDFNADLFDHAALGFIGGASIFSTLGERDPISTYDDFVASDGTTFGSTFVKEFGRHWDSTVPITIQGESLPYVDQFMDLDPNYTDAWGMPLLRLTFDWHDNDERLYRYIAGVCKDILQAMGPDEVADFTPDLGAYVLDRYQSTHITGGAIMGDDPATSVTNSYGQIWDVPNLFVTGAALYPQNPGANPTGTLAALAYRTGEAVRDRFDGDLMERV